jgi:hypothetical protein
MRRGRTGWRNSTRNSVAVSRPLIAAKSVTRPRPAPVYNASPSSAGKRAHDRLHPRRRHKREDLTPYPVLFWPVGVYLIVYRADRRPIEIVAVTRDPATSLPSCAGAFATETRQPT